MKKRFSNIESVPLFALATLVDPRFKKVAFTSVSSCYQGQSRLISEMSPLAPSTPSQPPQEAPENSVDYNKELWKKFDDMVAAAHNHQSVSTEATIECRRYFEQRNIPRTSDPLIWWKDNAAHYPLLQRVARKYLCVPATSVSSERLFSKAGQLVCKRSRIKPNNIDMMLFLIKK